jgi:hypothetical protein
MIACVACAAQAETKKKEPPKAAPAAANKKPAREKGDILIGSLTKTDVDGKPVYTLQISPSEKIELSKAMADKMYINLDSYAGKRVALSCFQDDATKKIKSMLWMKTEADYKKMGGGK